MPVRALQWRAVLCLAAAAVCHFGWPAVAAAQTTTVARPFRPIFGAVPERPNSRQALDFTATLEQAMGHDPQLQEASWYPEANLDLQYRWRVRNVRLAANAGSSGQYYSHRDHRLDRSHNGGASLDVPIGRWTQIRLGHTSSYASFYTLAGLPGGALPDVAGVLPGQELLTPRAEFAMANTDGWQHSSRVTVSQQVAPGGSVEGRYEFGRSNLARQQTTRRDVGLRYRQAFTRDIGIVAGYGVETNVTGAGAAIGIRNIDLGLDYHHALSKFRNTTVALTTGSAVITRSGANEYRLLADARLIRLMGRSWTTSLAFNRGVDYMPVLGDVLASDAVIATLDGFASRALQTSISTSYSRGTLGARANEPVTTFTGIARIEYGFARSVALDAQYSYYFHELGPAAASSAAPFVPELTQQRVRVGLNFWLPMLH